MKTALTIAGSDCSGGAGIQADIKTMAAHGVYAMSVITALTAQNTTGVYGVCNIEPEFVGKQIDCVFTDIRPDAVKVGMVSEVAIIKEIAVALKRHDAKNIVIDPVMISTSGSPLLSKDAMDALINELLPLADVITPNLHEAAALCGFEVKSHDDMIRAAKLLSERGNYAVLIKGGHLVGSADDLLYINGEVIWHSLPLIDNPNTHGTGCTLSSAIASNLAMGRDMKEAVREAKAYVAGAIAAGMDLGKGSGPLDHGYRTR